MFYPIVFNKATKKLRVPSFAFDNKSQQYIILEQLDSHNEITILPIKDDGSDGRWYLGFDRVKNSQEELKAEIQPDGTYRVYYRRRPNAGVQPTTHWSDSKYSATEHGTAVIKQQFGSQESFSYPKSIYAVIDCLSVAGVAQDGHATVLDYFAGSGTTGHAVISLNRDDKEDGKRKYILVEQGEYFDTVLKPRIQKVVYAADWKDGKAANHSTGISHAFKVLKLESYEDTLNNLELTRPNTDLFEHMTPEQQNDYLMHYMLKLESKDSLLSVKQFQKPFSYQLNITTDSAGAYQKRPVDLVETFNYLLGLRVKHIDMQQHKGYVQVVGHLPTGEHTCILWRDCETLPYAKLDSLLAKLHINPNDREYDLIYINGDHNIPSVYIGSDGSERQLKVRSIEHEFFARMFAESM